MKVLLLPLLLALCSCTSHVQTTEIGYSDLNFLGKATLKIEQSNKLWLADGPTLITKGNNTVSYGIISQEHLQFIGTSNTPAEFLRMSFSGKGEEPEKVFFETFKDYSINTTRSENIDFYELESLDDKYIYIATPELNFIIEISSRNPDAISLPEIESNFRLSE